MQFLFPPRESAATVVRRLAANQWQGQIIGPHGSGKSTLLRSLLPEIEARGRRAVLIELHDGQRRLPPQALAAGGDGRPRQLIVDGYEQLGWWSRRRLRRGCRRHAAGLLITAHQDVGLPTLFRTEVSKALAVELARRLVDLDTGRIHQSDVVQAIELAEGNLREALFRLYDLYELRKL